MNIDYDHIQNLVLKELEGTINAKEKETLSRIAAENPEVQQVREDMKRFLTGDVMQKAVADLPKRLPYERLQKKIRRRKQGPWRVAASIAAICAISVGLYFFFTPKKGAQEIARSTKDVELRLAGGEVINLSKQTGDSIRVGNRVLSNVSKSLSFTIYRDTSNAGSAGSGVNSLTVPVGLDYHVVLADGSEIWLNSATNLRFPFRFTEQSREISVSGEAYLKVAKDSDKPFLVHTPRGTVQVLGTEFNVNSYDSGMVRVALVEGAVRLKTHGRGTAIKPGQEVISEADGIRIRSFDPYVVLAWRDGLYRFSDVTLKEISRVLSRWYGVEVVMDREPAGDQRFFGTIDRSVPVKTFLDNLKATYSVDYYIDNKGIIHFR